MHILHDFPTNVKKNFCNSLQNFIKTSDFAITFYIYKKLSGIIASIIAYTQAQTKKRLFSRYFNLFGGAGYDGSFLQRIWMREQQVRKMLPA